MKWIASATLFAGVVLFIFPASARAETIVSSDIISDTTWTLAGSPYVVSGFLEIDSSVTLTIEPGVVVKFDTGAELSVSGALRAEGTESQPIYFTSLLDDTVGGDTNGDSSDTVPSARDWVHIGFAPGAEGTFTHATIRYGGYVEEDPGDPPDPFTGIFNDGATVSLEYVTLSHNGEDGLVQTGNGTTTVFVSLIEEHESGIVVDSGFLTVSYSRIINNDVGILAQRQFISPAPPAPVVSITDSEIAHNTHGILAFDVSLSIVNSIIHDNIVAGLHNNESGPLNAVGNWWGDSSGPTTLQNPGGTGDAILYGAVGTGSGSDSEDEVLFAPWLGEAPSLVPPSPPVPAECCSSVLFLPGIMGSRLYEDGEKRWEPSGEEDVQALYLDAEGKSISADTTAAEVIDEIPITGGNIYKSFLADLAAASSTGAIAGYAVIPYDWRLSIPDILADGDLEETLRTLAASSQTGKVAIVAHSNGGLLTKALVSALGAEASGLIDQLILVGVPQLGTPQAVGALLHGYDTGLPFDWFPLTLSPERARDFAKNAPFAYHLLPHSDYYSNAGASITTPLVVFETGEATQAFIDAYGMAVGNADELRGFLLGTEGRTAPAYDDLEHPSLGNTALLSYSETLQQEIGSSWQAPEGITVHQIAGIGEDTLAGITYKTIQECVQAVTFPGGVACLEYQPALSYTPETVVDGDGTVVVPSALAMSTSTEAVKRWWVDLKNNNKDNNRRWFFRLNHGDIFEVLELRTFIFNSLINQSSSALPEYIFETEPPIDSDNRLRFVLHSPLALSATDSDGNEISETVSTILGATYQRYGEVQVVTIPAELFPTVALTGIEDGSFTLEVEEYTGNTLIATTTFTGVPSLAGTFASIAFPNGTIQNAEELAVDYDGDGTVDIMLAPEAGEEVTLDEPSLSALLAALKEIVGGMDIKDKLKKNLLKRIENLEKKIEKKKEENEKTLAKLEKEITKQEAKGKIDTADADELLALLEELEAQAENVALDVEVLVALKEKIESLDIKKGLKNDLLKLVEKLENTQQLTKTLSKLSATILKKGEKGKIDNADVEVLLQLLEQIEQVI